MSEIPFWKGHGTRNDFILVPDPDGALSLSAVDVAAMCDKNAMDKKLAGAAKASNVKKCIADNS